MRISTAMLLALLSASVSCTSQSAGIAGVPGHLTITDEPSGLRLENHTDEPIAFTAFDRGYAARIQFAPCLDTSPSCLRLPARTSIVVPYNDIGGYSPHTREVILYWWHLVPDPAGGYRADEIRATVVVL